MDKREDGRERRLQTAKLKTANCKLRRVAQFAIFSLQFSICNHSCLPIRAFVHLWRFDLFPSHRATLAMWKSCTARKVAKHSRARIFPCPVSYVFIFAGPAFR